jgi:hypothetical protein
MLHTKTFLPMAAAALLAFGASGLQAKTAATGITPPAGIASFATDINIAGWQTFAGFGNPLNTEVFLNFPAGTGVLGFEFIGVTFTTENGSWGSELVLSVNNIDASEWLDWSPDTTDDSGTFGPLTGTFGGAVGAPGPFGEGGPFTLADGVMWVTVYEGFNDGGDARDALITAGTLRVFTTAPIPEPGTYALMALGLAGIALVARRRRAD